MHSLQLNSGTVLSGVGQSVPMTEDPASVQDLEQLALHVPALQFCGFMDKETANVSLFATLNVLEN